MSNKKYYQLNEKEIAVPLPNGTLILIPLDEQGGKSKNIQAISDLLKETSTNLFFQYKDIDISSSSPEEYRKKDKLLSFLANNAPSFQPGLGAPAAFKDSFEAEKDAASTKLQEDIPDGSFDFLEGSINPLGSPGAFKDRF